MYKHYGEKLDSELCRRRLRFFRHDDRADAIADAIMDVCDVIENEGAEIAFLYQYLKARAFNKLRNRSRTWRIFYDNNRHLNETEYNQDKLSESLSEYAGTENIRNFAVFKKFCLLTPKCQKRINLRMKDNYSFREIGEMMSPVEKESTARQNHKRCLDKLKNLIKE